MKEFKVKKPAFFKPGSLVFSDSRHKLIKDGKYYRCVEDTNNRCKFKEKQILSETLERNFSRKAFDFQNTDIDADKIIKKIMRDHFWDLVFGLDDRIDGKEEILDSTLEVMQSDLKKTGRLNKSDEKDFMQAYTEKLKSEHTVMLFGYAVAIIRAFTIEMNEASMGRTIAHLLKRVFLDQKGNVEAIEFERWAWYLLNNVVEKNCSGYLSKLNKWKIMNGSDSLHQKGLVEASLGFGSEDFQDAMGEDFVISVGWIKLMRDIFKMAFNNDPEKMDQAVPLLLNMLQNDPALQMMIKSTAVIKLK